MSSSTSSNTKLAVQEIEKTLSTLRNTASKANNKIDSINWNKYETQIKDKKLVQELKKQYDEQIKALPLDESKPSFLTQLNHEFDAIIKQAESAAELSKSLLPKLDQQLKNSEKSLDDRINWNMDTWYNNYPGLQQQHRDEYMDGTYIIPERVLRIGNVDPVELAKSMQSGAHINFSELDPKFGDFTVESKINELKSLESKLIDQSASKTKELNPTLYVDDNPGDAVNPDYKPGEHH